MYLKYGLLATIANDGPQLQCVVYVGILKNDMWHWQKNILKLSIRIPRQILQFFTNVKFMQKWSQCVCMFIYTHVYMCVCTYIYIYIYVSVLVGISYTLTWGLYFKEHVDIFCSISPHITSPMCLSLPMCREHSKSYAYNVYAIFFLLFLSVQPFNEGAGDGCTTVFPPRTWALFDKALDMH